MKLTNFKNIEHPHHSNTCTSIGLPLYNFQDEARIAVIDDLKQILNSKKKKKLNILKIPTGDGKSFITEVLVRDVLFIIQEAKNKKAIIYLTSPMIEVIEELKSKMLELARSDNSIELFFDKEERNARQIKHYRKGSLNETHKIFVFSDQWAINEKNSNLLTEKPDFIIRDESKGANASTEDEARIYFGDYKWGGVWYEKLMSYGGYALCLNATPTAAQKSSRNFNILNIEIKQNLWKKPFLDSHCLLIAETPSAKKSEIKRFLRSFLQFQIQNNYNIKLINDNKLNDYKKKTAIIKCSGENSPRGLLTTEVFDLIKKLESKLINTKFEIIDPRTEEIVNITYEGGLLCPMIKDSNYTENSIDFINNPNHPENILIVCELGTYGINVLNCSYMFLVRDSKHQHIGKTYSVEQLFGRLKRNQWIDWIHMLDNMLKNDIDVKDWGWVIDTYMNVASKTLWSLTTKVTENAFSNFSQEIPSRREVRDTLDDLVLNLFKYLPSDKDVMISTGDSEDRNYSNERNEECDLCDNLIFDIHYEKLVQRGYDKVTAKVYAIKDMMDNGHRHTRDDGTQRSICKSCHAIESRENNHHLASDNPERKEVE